MPDNRPSVYVDYDDGGKVIYRASSLGMCVRALVAIAHGGYEEALGKDRADLLDRTSIEGEFHEGAVRAKLEHQGWKIHSTQDVVEIPVIKGVVIRGHTDGIVSSSSDEPSLLLEVKSMSNKRFDRWIKTGFEGFLKYAYQISAYMQATPDLDVIYIAKRREDGFENRQIIKAGEPPIAWSVIKKKVLAVEGFRRKGRGFPDCDVPPSEQFWCPFFYLHDEVVDSVDTEMTEEMLAVLIDLIPKRLELSELEKEGKDAEILRKELDKEILNLMGKQDKVIVEVDDQDYQITRVNGSSNYLDQTKLRADMGEEILPYEKTTRFQYPKITPKKKQIKK